MEPLFHKLNKCDPQEVLRAIAVLFDPKDIVELRVLNAHDGERPHGTVVGYFDGEHRQQLADAVCAWSGLAPAIYCTLNPVNPACLARAANYPKRWVKITTKDPEILRRRWLFIDFDAKRPAGISSTDTEHDAAIAQARVVRDWLTQEGWPEPILADSGNGAHLLYRIDLPNDKESLALVKSLLRALSDKWSTDSVEVDKGNFNAARVCKFYGTLSAKGDALPDRPHRISKMLEVPEAPTVVPRSCLDALGKPATAGKATGQPSSSIAAGFDVQEWIERHGVPISKRKPYADGGILWELAHCPWKPTHPDGGPFIIQFENGIIKAGCHHNSCQNRKWSDFRDHYEPGWRAAIDSSIVVTNVREAPTDPHRLAKLFIQKCASHPSWGLTLRRWAGEWYRWNGRIYIPRPDNDVKDELVATVKAEFDRIAAAKSTPDSPETSEKVTLSLINNVAMALKSLVRVSVDMQPPAWLAPQTSPWPASEIVVAQNGLIHLPSFLGSSDFLLPLTPEFFAISAFDFDVIREPGEPERWLHFLSQLWPNDKQSIEALQMWFGLCLTTDTSHQKILGIFGPPRSGKGTIARVLTALVGNSNVAAPTLAGLTTQFGLQSLLGKTLAIISDARFGGRISESSIIVERLLSISGEDTLTIDRKNLTAVTLKLPTRFVLMSNELPRLGDASGAFPSRLIILQLSQSFLGEEDTQLTGKLLSELPAIFRWAAAGWSNLKNVGRLVEPSSSALIRRDMQDISSPVGQFVRERCVTGPLREILRSELYKAYVNWCKQAGITYVENMASFGKNLRAVLPNLDSYQPRVDGGRDRYYVGIDITDETRRLLILS